MKVQKLTDIGSADHEVEPYLTDPAWVMQQKFDGARVMMIHDAATDSFRWTNDGETELKFSAALLRLPLLEEHMRVYVLPSMDSLRNGFGELILDGELIIESGEYHVFDILEDPAKPLGVRLTFIDLLPETSHVRRVRTYRSEQAKRQFWAGINEAGVEGAVSKHLDSRYEPGTRSKFWLKHKLVKSCECVVTSVERTFKDNGVVKTGSAGLAVYSETGELIPIAKASLIGRELTIEPGSVVEVNYLFRQDGGQLVQPRIVRQRFDRTPADCVESQIPAYSRVAVR